VGGGGGRRGRGSGGAGGRGGWVRCGVRGGGDGGGGGWGGEGRGPSPMKAVAVRPRKADSIELRDVARPDPGAIRDGRGVLVKVLRWVSTAPTRRSVKGSTGTRLSVMTS